MNADAASRTGSVGWWPWALIAGAVALFVGGMLPPEKDPALSGHAAEAAWIGDPVWVPSHSLILLSSILFAIGLTAARRLTNPCEGAEGSTPRCSVMTSRSWFDLV